MSIKIEVVKTKEDFNEFYKLPWKVYKNDAYWVPPLFSDIRDMFDKNKNPLFHHAQVESFIAKRDGEVVGRISAIIDENSNKFHNEKTGFFGFFEVIEDYEVAVALFDKAKEWCKAKDMKIFRGPTNFTTNDECAFLLEGFDSSPMIMMTYNPKYYLDFAEKYGFKKAKDLYAFYRYAKDGIPERILKLAERIKKRGNIKIRYLNMKKFDEELNNIKDIYNSAWENNWGFIPMTDAEIEYMAKKLKPIIIPELFHFAEVDGKAVAVSMALPNYNIVLKKLNGKLGPIEMLKFLFYKRKIDEVRLFGLGIKKEYQKKGIDVLFYCEIFDRVKALGWKGGELSWILEDNSLMNDAIITMGGKVYKKYRIYEMPLDSIAP